MKDFLNINFIDIAKKLDEEITVTISESYLDSCPIISVNSSFKVYLDSNFKEDEKLRVTTVQAYSSSSGLVLGGFLDYICDVVAPKLIGKFKNSNGEALYSPLEGSTYLRETSEDKFKKLDEFLTLRPEYKDASKGYWSFIPIFVYSGPEYSMIEDIYNKEKSYFIDEAENTLKGSIAILFKPTEGGTIDLMDLVNNLKG